MTLKLTHDGDNWHGTFGVLTRTLVNDLLSDGAPFDATITVDRGDGKRTTKVTGSVLEITGRDEVTIDPTDGDTQYVGVDDILAIEVP